VVGSYHAGNPDWDPPEGLKRGLAKRDFLSRKIAGKGLCGGGKREERPDDRGRMKRFILKMGSGEVNDNKGGKAPCLCPGGGVHCREEKREGSSPHPICGGVRAELPMG